MLDKFKFDNSTFSLTIENKALSGLTYLEAILEFCEERNIEFDTIGSVLKRHDVIKKKLEAECRDKNLLLEKRSAKIIY